MAEINMIVTLGIVEVDTSGSSCDACEDPIYLKEYAFTAQVGMWKPEICSKARVCQSCADAMR